MRTPQTQIYSYGRPEMSTFGIFRGRNVQAIRSVAEMSEHRSHSVAVTMGTADTKSKSSTFLWAGAWSQMTSA